LGGCVALLPLLTGRSDVLTTLIVSGIASLAILPVWRYAGAGLTSPVAYIPLLELVIGPIVIAGVFSVALIATYLGTWFCALGSVRLAAGWRDPPG
jgi:hypothetical protein